MTTDQATNSPSSPVAQALRAYAAAIDDQDWGELTALLAPEFHSRSVHNDRVDDRESHVALNRDYPGRWRFEAEDVVAAGRSGALRARVSDATGASSLTFGVAVFATVDGDGLITEAIEVWTDGTGSATPRLDYVEITVADLDRSRAFYAAAFGWTFNDYGPGYAGIRAETGPAEVGGLIVADPAPGTGGGVLALVRSPGLAASLRAVVEAGGEVLAGPYDYPGGRRFELADPDGNRIGVYQPA